MSAIANKYLRVALFCILNICIGTALVFSQPFSNNWINYSQRYLKIKIVNEGIYRISYNTLNNALIQQTGISAGSINPKTFQIYGRGQEQYIYVEGEGDNVFNTTDFIEFYAAPNDGYYDASLYPSGEHSNPYYSNFSDTAVYFLTWNSSTSNNRMGIDNDQNYAGAPAPSAYFWANSVKVFNDEYFYGEIDYNGQSRPGYYAGEGWFSGAFSKPSSYSQTLTAANVYASGPSAVLKTNVISASNDAGVYEDNELKIDFQGQTLKDTVLEGYQLMKFSFQISPSLLSTNNNMVFTSLNPPNLSANPGRMAVGFIDLKYPHTFDFENKTSFKFHLPFSGVAKNHIQISNFNNQSSTERLYNLTSHQRITVGLNGSIKSAILTEFGIEQTCYLTSDNQIQNISSLIAVNGNGYFTNYSSQLPGKHFIIITNRLLEESASNYKVYRTGQGLPAEVIYVDELYDQFAQGILKHPLAIKNFADYVYHQFSDAEYFFYLGKSISSELTRKNTDISNYQQNLVPSFGYPASDLLFNTYIINGSTQEPAFASGRLAAIDDKDVDVYLAKVNEYEAVGLLEPNAEWRKQVLHFAGGSNAGEANILQYFLNLYEDTVEAPYFGGNVTNFKKTSTAPIQIPTSDSIKTLVNQGVSIMTFFGHASGSGFDVDLDSPDNYQNVNGKYPLLIGNSCFAGDIHQPVNVNVSSSEQWTLSSKGTIGFLAQVGAGFPSQLFTYTSELYSQFSRKNYSKSIGKCIKQTIRAIQSPSDYILTATCLEMTLHGDPAIVIASPENPDLMVNESNIIVTPTTVTTDLDSFKVSAIITNLGKAVTQPVEVLLQHKSINYTATIASGLSYKDTVGFYINIDPLTDAGINTFTLTVDPINMITPEITEANNTTTFNINILSNDIFPVYPYEYAIVPDNKVILKGSTADPFASVRNYMFEIDTTDLFNSGLLQKGTVTSAGGMVEWNTNNITLLDSTKAVYFWRVSIDTAGTNNNAKWRESSFQYIPQKTGWGQSHVFQYKKDKFTFIDYNKPARRFDYSNNVRTLKCTTYGNATTQNEWFGSEVRLDLEQIDYGGCAGDYICVMVFDSLDLKPWGTRFGGQNPNHNFGNINDNGGCRNRVENYFSFDQMDSQSMDSCASMLAQVPNGFYVLVYTFHVGLHQTAITLPVRNQLIALGSSAVNNVTDGNPYIFCTRKGIGPMQEVYGSLPNDKLELSYTLSNDWYYGFVTTPVAGPATQWNEFHWDRFSRENPSSDSAKIEFYGVKADGSEFLLRTVSTDTLDILNLGSFMDAGIYPYAKLKLYTSDELTRTPTQLKYWRLYYAPAPEAAVAPNLFLTYTSGNIQEGQEFNFKMAIKNISTINMDSMMVKYWIEDENRQIHQINYSFQSPKPLIRQDSLYALDTMIIGVKYPSNGLSGINTFWVEINPNNDQLEQFHFNNFASLRFNVDRDKYNPLLDVTFDGIHILDGDIVSAKPEISIQLKDENQYLLMNEEKDTANFRVSLLRPGSNIPERIYFRKNGVEILKYTPAQNSENRFKIEYKPEFVADGKYQLIVQAVDISGNKSGAFDYKTSFEVITKSTITEVMNYPNPFSTSTHFVFTLTGSVIPETFKIQIFNISGRVVKEIDASELGPIHIGRNITEYAWDGRDDFGDRLANGVYFYKVYTRIDKSEIEKMQTNADQYFKKGFGKMVIIH